MTRTRSASARLLLTVMYAQLAICGNKVSSFQAELQAKLDGYDWPSPPVLQHADFGLRGHEAQWSPTTQVVQHFLYYSEGNRLNRKGMSFHIGCHKEGRRLPKNDLVHGPVYETTRQVGGGPLLSIESAAEVGGLLNVMALRTASLGLNENAENNNQWKQVQFSIEVLSKAVSVSRKSDYFYTVSRPASHRLRKNMDDAIKDYNKVMEEYNLTDLKLVRSGHQTGLCSEAKEHVTIELMVDDGLSLEEAYPYTHISYGVSLIQITQGVLWNMNEIGSYGREYYSKLVALVPKLLDDLTVSGGQKFQIRDSLALSAGRLVRDDDGDEFHLLDISTADDVVKNMNLAGAIIVYFFHILSTFLGEYGPAHCSLTTDPAKLIKTALLEHRNDDDYNDMVNSIFFDNRHRMRKWFLKEFPFDDQTLAGNEYDKWHKHVQETLRADNDGLPEVERTNANIRYGLSEDESTLTSERSYLVRYEDHAFKALGLESGPPFLRWGKWDMKWTDERGNPETVSVTEYARIILDCGQAIASPGDREEFKDNPLSVGMCYVGSYWADDSQYPEEPIYDIYYILKLGESARFTKADAPSAEEFMAKQVETAEDFIYGLREPPTVDDCKKMYRIGALNYHSDKMPDAKDEAKEFFKIISAAYQITQNPNLKVVYDEWRTQGGDWNMTEFPEYMFRKSTVEKALLDADKGLKQYQ